MISFHLAGPLTFKFHSALLFLTIVIGLVRAGPSNRTIDDEEGDVVTRDKPVYQGPWKLGSNCTDCFVKPDKTLAFDNTWHDATVDLPDDIRNITLTFTGTAVYVYAIIPNTVPDATTTVNTTFILNKRQPTTFIHTPNSSNVFQFDFPVYSQENLQNKEHQLVITPNAGSIFLFDYAVYTFDDTPTPSSTTSSNSPSHTAKNSQDSSSPAPLTGSSATSTPSIPVGAIVGIVIGVLAFIAALLLLVFCLRRKRRQRPGTGGRLDIDPESRPPSRAPFGQLDSGQTPFGVPSTSQAHLVPSRSSVLITRPLPVPGVTQSSVGIPQRTTSLISPPVASFAAAGMSTEATPLSTKARMREQELQRQLASAEAALALQAQASDWPQVLPRPSVATIPESADGHPSLYTLSTSDPGRTRRGSDEESLLRDRVEHLQAEVDRLRLVTADAPPAYEGRALSPVSTLLNPYSDVQSEAGAPSELGTRDAGSNRMAVAPRLRLQVATPEKNAKDFTDAASESSSAISTLPNPYNRASSTRKSRASRSGLMPPSATESDAASTVSTLPNPYSRRTSMSTLAMTLPNPHS